MPTYTADQLIGKTLFARKDILGYYNSPGSKNTFKIYKDQTVGTVYSWVQKYTPDHKLWWQFYDKAGRVYYTKNEDLYMGKYDLATTKTQEQKIKEEEEKKEKDDKGTFIYYLEKYGKNVLIGAAVTYVVVQGTKIYFENRKRNEPAY